MASHLLWNWSRPASMNTCRPHGTRHESSLSVVALGQILTCFARRLMRSSERRSGSAQLTMLHRTVQSSANATHQVVQQLMKHAAICILLMFTTTFSASTIAGEQKRVAITIDDVPFLATTPMTVDEAVTLNRSILDVLVRHDVKAVGFVNEDRLLVPGGIDRGISILDAWLDAGMELGNHNFGHIGLWQSSLSKNMEAVVKGEVLTRWVSDRKGATLRYYRHPYTQTGKDVAEKEAFDGFLASHGYTVAPFTMEHDDYMFSCVYEQLAGQEAERDSRRATVVSEYDAHLRQSVATFETMSDELFGRQIPQVFLLHATRLNADTLDRTLSTLRDMDYQFVSLEEALQDEAYKLPIPPSRQFGPSWLARWAREKGVKLTAYGQADPRGITASLYGELCAEQ